MWTIENDHLKVQCRAQGAELTSIIDKQDQIEHLWQADPAYWGWHAPVLFPVVGRCNDDQLQINWQHYTMEKHGFARKSLFDLKAESPTSITFSLSANENTVTIFPYTFELLITYSLHGKTLLTTYEVHNLGTEIMYFSLGAHPAMAVPFSEGENYSDYFIEFPKDKQLDRHFINTEGFFTGETQEALTQEHRLDLNPTLFTDDALIFKKIDSKRIFLKSTQHSKFLSFEFKDFDYLGLWAKNNASYVCVEPWLGCADSEGFKTDISQKEGIISLEPAAKKTMHFSIGLNE